MRLVAACNLNHWLFNTTHFNLGGEYFYEFTENEAEQVIIKRIKNKLFLKGFYSEKSRNLSLVSAVVGANGSGKSTLFRLIRQIFKSQGFFGDSEGQGYVLLFEEENEVFIKSNLTVSGILGEESPKSYSLFVCENFKPSRFEKNLETVYMTPFLDQKRYYIDFHQSPDIDISLDRLFQLDYSDNSTKQGANSYEEHRLQNTLRQVQYLSSTLAEDLHNKFGVPYFEKLKISFRGPNVNQNTNIRNVPYEFRPFFEKLFNLWNGEINSTSRQISDDLGENRRIVKLWVLRGLLQTMYECLEYSNYFLDEGRVRIEIEALEGLSLYEGILRFLDNHYFVNRVDKSVEIDLSLPIIPIKDLVESIFLAIDSLDRHNFIEPKEFVLDFKTSAVLLNKHSAFLNGLRSFKTIPIGFIDVEPPFDLSSGEKAVLDLLSRFQFANSEIRKRIDGDRSGSIDYSIPNHFLLLLDEGDIGLHPSWKKKYVQTIINVLPKFFEEFDQATVQIIFSTHDPITLSDILSHNIVYLKKENDENLVLDYDSEARPSRSFGANIASLLADSFFIDDGLIGEFAKSKIDDAIAWLGDIENLENGEYYENLIRCIDEPIVQRKLTEMYTEKTKRGFFEKDIIAKQIEILQRRQDQLNRNEE